MVYLWLFNTLFLLSANLPPVEKPQEYRWFMYTTANTGQEFWNPSQHSFWDELRFTSCLFLLCINSGEFWLSAFPSFPPVAAEKGWSLWRRWALLTVGVNNQICDKKGR